jgi:hypothetical protein
MKILSTKFMIIPNTFLGNFIKPRKISVRTSDPGLDQNRPEVLPQEMAQSLDIHVMLHSYQLLQTQVPGGRL